MMDGPVMADPPAETFLLLAWWWCRDLRRRKRFLCPFFHLTEPACRLATPHGLRVWLGAPVQWEQRGAAGPAASPPLRERRAHTGVTAVQRRCLHTAPLLSAQLRCWSTGMLLNSQSKLCFSFFSHPAHMSVPTHSSRPRKSYFMFEHCNTLGNVNLVVALAKSEFRKCVFEAYYVLTEWDSGESVPEHSTTPVSHVCMTVEDDNTLETQTVHASKHMTGLVSVDDVGSSQLGDRIVWLRPMRWEVCAAGR